MNLATFWFILIAILWAGYFVLEGFDFGVGILLPFLGRDDTERRVMINTIGPVWDGNEVWLLTAGGATFAAFPLWYASLFSGFYLALLLILAALIVRGVCFEFRSKVGSPRWRANWDRAIFAGSALPALLWGGGLRQHRARGPAERRARVHRQPAYPAQLVRPARRAGHAQPVHPARRGLPGRAHLRRAQAAGASGRGPRRARGRAAGRGLPGRDPVPLRQARHRRHRCAGRGRADRRRVRRVPRWEGWAFAATAVTLLLAVATLFGDLWPNVLPSSTNPAYSLTVDNASSAHYTLVVMSWVAVIFTPIVLGYQGWTYWVFRKRLTRSDIVLPPATGTETVEPVGGRP
jgi:cytochrome bd ubiquinol oxidase subunit II